MEILVLCEREGLGFDQAIQDRSSGSDLHFLFFFFILLLLLLQVPERVLLFKELIEEFHSQIAFFWNSIVSLQMATLILRCSIGRESSQSSIMDMKEEEEEEEEEGVNLF
jgi:hypothetical protein